MLGTVIRCVLCEQCGNSSSSSIGKIPPWFIRDRSSFFHEILVDDESSDLSLPTTILKIVLLLFFSRASMRTEDGEQEKRR